MATAFRQVLGASTVIAAAALCVGGCDDPGATVSLTDARIFRDGAKNVVVDVDLLGHEGLGGSAGTYCIRVTFVDPTDVRVECKSDLEDGDTRTARFVGGNLEPGTVVKVRLRLNVTDARRDLVAPPR